MKMIEILQKALGKQAEIEMHPMQPGDVKETYADIDALNAAVGYQPTTDLQEGLDAFARWYKEFYD